MAFMRMEGYPEEEVRAKAAQINQLGYDRIHLAIARFQKGREADGRLLQKAFDHLRLMVKFRKLMKYQLGVCNNRVQYMKADLQQAFNKWRQSDTLRAASLNKIPRKELMAWNIKQTTEMIRLANKEAESDNTLKHLALQRDELLEHYIRGQKLSLSACRNKHLKGLGIAISRWKDLVRFERRQEVQLKIIDAVDRLAALKDKIREDEREN